MERTLDSLLYEHELPAIFMLISFLAGLALGWLIRSGPDDPTT